MKKIGLIGLILVLCLAVVGVGYAHWSKTLVINGKVTTGTFDLEMSQYEAIDNEDIKDVGMAYCVLVDEDGDGVNEAVDLIIENAYPSYAAIFYLDIHCLGTVPAHINSVSVEADPFLDVMVMGLDPLPIQLHECDYADFQVRIHVLQNNVDGDLLPQGATLVCRITIVADQFNV